MFSLPCFKQSDCSKCGRGLFHIQCAKRNTPYHYQQELEDSLETLFILAYSRYDFNISEMYLRTTDYITKTADARNNSPTPAYLQNYLQN